MSIYAFRHMHIDLQGYILYANEYTNTNTHTYIYHRGQRHAPARLDLHWCRGCLRLQARLWWQGFEGLYICIYIYVCVWEWHFQCQWIIPWFLKYSLHVHIYIISENSNNERKYVGAVRHIYTDPLANHLKWSDI